MPREETMVGTGIITITLFSMAGTGTDLNV
jgi:hypothetical protein